MTALRSLSTGAPLRRRKIQCDWESPRHRNLFDNCLRRHHLGEPGLVTKQIMVTRDARSNHVRFDDPLGASAPIPSSNVIADVRVSPCRQDSSIGLSAPAPESLLSDSPLEDSPRCVLLP